MAIRFGLQLTLQLSFHKYDMLTGVRNGVLFRAALQGATRVNPLPALNDASSKDDTALKKMRLHCPQVEQDISLP